MFAKPTANYHHRLTARLRTDPTFAFEFARTFRDIPPIAPEDMMPMALVTFDVSSDLRHQVSFGDIVLGAKVRPSAAPLPGREPWPARWALLIDVIEAWPESTMLLDWPLRYASVRAQLGCPVTAIVVVPTLELAIRVNELFSIEPELTPVVVVSDALRNTGGWMN
jgi:hypothetical protein